VYVSEKNETLEIKKLKLFNHFIFIFTKHQNKAGSEVNPIKDMK